jgi:type II secretory pathway predicted ATPase ExeA/pSer/pThr/pTyr-binding forkhead associated (FHA) protein
VFLSFPTLTEDPFRNAPDPRFHFPARQQAAARAWLESSEFYDGGFAVVTGEAGTGKSCLVDQVVTSLPPRVVAVNLDPPPQSADEVCEGVIAAFAHSAPGKRKSDLFGAASTVLLRNHADDRRAALIIDDAQDLKQRVLAGVRLLADVRSGDQPVLAIMLAGRPELEQSFAQAFAPGPDADPSSRVPKHFRLEGFDAQETADYIGHRLAVAGDGQRQAFAGDTYELICQHTAGVPRQINKLCALAMRRAHRQGQAVVSAAIVTETLRNFDPLEAALPRRVVPRPQPARAEATARPGRMDSDAKLRGRRAADAAPARDASGAERDVMALAESVNALKAELAKSAKQRTELSKALEAIQAEKERLAAELAAREAAPQNLPMLDDPVADTDDRSPLWVVSARVMRNEPPPEPPPELLPDLPAEPPPPPAPRPEPPPASRATASRATAPRATAPPPAAPAQPVIPGRRCLLVALDRDGRVREHALEKSTVLLGSSADNDIRIESAYISPHHAQLFLTETGAMIGDLSSINGTYVNAQRIRRQVLRNGDVITVGKHRFKYVEEIRVEPKAPPSAYRPGWLDE